MAKRRPKGSKLQSAAAVVETTVKEGATTPKKKSPEPKAKKSRLAKVPEVIHIDSSPEKEPPVPKPRRASKLSRTFSPDQRRKVECAEKYVKVTDSGTSKINNLEDKSKPSGSQPRKPEPEETQREEKASCVTFSNQDTFATADQEVSPGHDFPLCSQSTEAHSDVIWQSTSPISLTQAAKVVSKKSTSTADLIKKYSHKNAEPGSPILRASSTPPLLGLWSSASTSKAHAKRRLRGVKRSGTGAASSEDIIMKLSLVLESKSANDQDEPEEAMRPEAPFIEEMDVNDTELKEQSTSEEHPSLLDVSPSKGQNCSLELFESEGYLTQSHRSTGVSEIATDDGTKDENEVVKVPEKAVSQGFDVSSVGNVEDPNPKVEEKPSNQLCEDLWADDDLDDDSFVLKATQELFDSEAFSTPNIAKSLKKTSTPLAAKKGGRLTFSLNPINMKPNGTIAAQGAAVMTTVAPSCITSSAPSRVVKPSSITRSMSSGGYSSTVSPSTITTLATTGVLNSSRTARAVNSRGYSAMVAPSSVTTTVNGVTSITKTLNSISSGHAATKPTATFKKPLPAAVISPPSSNVPFQSYGHKNSAVSFDKKVSPNIAGVKTHPPKITPLPVFKPAVAKSAEVKPLNVPNTNCTNAVIGKPSTYIANQGSMKGQVKSSLMSNKIAPAGISGNSNCTAGSKGKLPGSVSVKSGANVKKPETVASMSLLVHSELEMMDTSLGDDLLLSLAEPDEVLDTPQVPRQVISERQQNPYTEKPAESAWDEDEDEELLLMTSQAVECSLKTVSNVNPGAVPVLPKKGDNKKQGPVPNNHAGSMSGVVQHGRVSKRSPSKIKSNNLIRAKSLVSDLHPNKSIGQKFPTTVQSSSATTSRNFLKSGPAFSHVPTTGQTSSASNTVSMGPMQSNHGSNKVSPLTTKPSSLSHHPRLIQGPVSNVETVPKSSATISVKSAPKPVEPMTDQKESGMDDTFPGDDEMLCEDQVLALLEQVESQQMSQVPLKDEPHLVLCSTQKPVPGPTQQSNRHGHPGLVGGASAAPSTSHKLPGKPFSVGNPNSARSMTTKDNNARSKEPLAPLSYNQTRQLSKGTPPIPDISPIKLLSQPGDELLGSTINLAIVDKHYPKCSPEEIERKKAEALKRRQKKKLSA